MDPSHTCGVKLRPYMYTERWHFVGTVVLYHMSMKLAHLEDVLALPQEAVEAATAPSGGWGGVGSAGVVSAAGSS